jgi:hypothetical protein
MDGDDEWGRGGETFHFIENGQHLFIFHLNVSFSQTHLPLHWNPFFLESQLRRKPII